MDSEKNQPVIYAIRSSEGPPAKTQDKLVEGLDYTIEDGRYVFTASYLSRRGHCCGSGCRNCPYENDSGRETKCE